MVWRQVCDRYGFVGNLCLNPWKTAENLKLLDQTYPSSNFRVLTNLCADVIIGQSFLEMHSSVTFVMSREKEALTIAA